jgi:enoyl-[acyl-carrier-protein] reductase (NADH)
MKPYNIYEVKKASVESVCRHVAHHLESSY